MEYWFTDSSKEIRSYTGIYTLYKIDPNETNWGVELSAGMRLPQSRFPKDTSLLDVLRSERRMYYY